MWIPAAENYWQEVITSSEPLGTTRSWVGLWVKAPHEAQQGIQSLLTLRFLARPQGSTLGQLCLASSLLTWMRSAGQGTWSFPSAELWWHHTWSAGLLSRRETWTYWSKQGLWRRLRTWSMCHMKGGWEIWDCSAWRCWGAARTGSSLQDGQFWGTTWLGGHVQSILTRNKDTRI